jgi:hypothetical protein
MIEARRMIERPIMKATTGLAWRAGVESFGIEVFAAEATTVEMVEDTVDAEVSMRRGAVLG